MNEATIKDLADGRYGIYIGTRLLGIAKDEEKALIGVKLINDAIEDARTDGYDEGNNDGYDDGYYRGGEDHQ